MGPNGDTPSWSLSHEVSLGALGGLAGFHGTVDVLITGIFESALPVMFNFWEADLVAGE